MRPLRATLTALKWNILLLSRNKGYHFIPLNALSPIKVSHCLEGLEASTFFFLNIITPLIQFDSYNADDKHARIRKITFFFKSSAYFTECRADLPREAFGLFLPREAIGLWDSRSNYAAFHLGLHCLQNYLFGGGGGGPEYKGLRHCSLSW